MLNGASYTRVLGNRIACNGGNGVHVGNGPANDTTNVFISENSINSNGRLGIDLGGLCDQNACTDDGVTNNDPGDTDTGPNNLQNFPVLTNITTVAGSATVQGTFNSTPNATFRLEFFASRVPNAAGYGEGTTFLGYTNVTTSASGNTNFAITFPANVLAGQYIAATATDLENGSLNPQSTSEFSGARWAGGEALPYQQAQLKAHNGQANDHFGWFSVAVSGNTMVAGALYEDGAATDSGAAYVFVRCGPYWLQQAYLKASNPGASDLFGYSVAVSGDTVVVGAPGETSNATGVNGNQADNSASNSGAAYVFVRRGGTWS